MKELAKRWTADGSLVEEIAADLTAAMPLFPKRLIRTDALVKEHGLLMSHIQVLVLLDSADMSIGALSSGLCIAKPNITPLVDHLLELGLVERIRDERDRRVVNVRLLPEGKAKVDAIRQSMCLQVTEWADNLTKAEAKELAGAMNALVRIARRVGEKK